MGMMSLDEPIFDNGQGVQVTTSLLRVGDDAYPIGSIKSVRLSRVPPSFGMLAVCVGCYILSFAMIARGVVAGPIGLAVFGSILLVVSRHLSKGLKMYDWRLRLITLTGTTQIMTAQKNTELAKIKIEIETALAMRQLSKLPEALSALKFGQYPKIA